jgi:hypothetical protein
MNDLHTIHARMVELAIVDAMGKLVWAGDDPGFAEGFVRGALLAGKAMPEHSVDIMRRAVHERLREIASRPT